MYPLSHRALITNYKHCTGFCYSAKAGNFTTSQVDQWPMATALKLHSIYLCTFQCSRAMSNSYRSMYSAPATWYNSTCLTLAPQCFKVTLWICAEQINQSLSETCRMKIMLHVVNTILRPNKSWTKLWRESLFLQKRCLTSTLPWPSCLTCLQEKTTSKPKIVGTGTEPTFWFHLNI